MGADSHPYIEVKGRNGRWGLRDDKERYWRMFEKEALSYEELDKRRSAAINILGTRNYRMFAAVADVRNRGEIEPLFDRRGLPDDASAAARSIIEDDGDLHSLTYFTLQELIDAPWDKECCKFHYGLFATQYQEWKETGKIPDDAKESWELEHQTKDPVHREVSEEEMLLLMLSTPPKDLVRRCDPAWSGDRKKVLGGPYVNLWLPVSYRRAVPKLYELIEHLSEYGPPDKVRVLIAYDN